MTHPTDILGYTFDADTYCVDCTERAYPGSTDWRREGYDPSAYVDSEGNELHPIFADSESDVPEHCASCRVFLETPLTGDGYDYVLAAVVESFGSGASDTVRQWWAFYGDDYPDSDLAEVFRTLASAM